MVLSGVHIRLVRTNENIATKLRTAYKLIATKFTNNIGSFFSYYRREEMSFFPLLGIVQKPLHYAAWSYP
jgi:hypothetical protein